MSVDRELERMFWPRTKKSSSKEPQGMDGAMKLLLTSFRDRGEAPRTSQMQRGGHRGAPAPNGGRLLRDELRAHLRKAPQVLVKITGKSRGVAGVQDHLQYISDGKHEKYQENERGEAELSEEWKQAAARRSNDELQRPIVTDTGERITRQSELDDLIQDWRRVPSLMPWNSDRAEALHVLYQMPSGTDPQRLAEAVKATASAEFEGHKWAMAVHEHQSTPHVHLLVRVERQDGRRLNPRKADLHRWRMRFAHELRSRGVDAAASRQRVRGSSERKPDVWERKQDKRIEALQERALRARALGRASFAEELDARAAALRRSAPTLERPASDATVREVAAARFQWQRLAVALQRSNSGADHLLAAHTRRFMQQNFGNETSERETKDGRRGNRSGRPVGRGVSQPDDRAARASQAAAGQRGLRRLSELPLVRFGERSEVLLQGDARGHLGDRREERRDRLRRLGDQRVIGQDKEQQR